ncbi:methyltransferase domain-containing protein [Cyanobium sp. ATX 6A2]|uniref:class I SAM-dependent methyltransferase n=1 Tax=Cyanobium sp. ATX 6A2 TaxID=2823700 RepID=UPI0020CBEFDD|nr:methyltransferase domain-containing protein [Cyanobium sp. ATX 6A2]MCP9886998.1 methyltransferase domain-containing protein [Cyanobium sp. ATX 6A2]
MDAGQPRYSLLNEISTAAKRAGKWPFLKIKSIQTRIKVSSILRRTAPIRLEIGAGNKVGAGGWITLDRSLGCDLTWDLRAGLPFPNNSLDSIYSSHVLEHIPFDDLRRLLRKCHRALKPGGDFSVCVPNARRYMEAYLAGKNLLEVEKAYTPGLSNTGSLIDQVNYIAYMGRGEHAYMFDQENLINIMRSAGFSKCRLRDFQPGLDMESRRATSIYAIGYKERSED